MIVTAQGGRGGERACHIKVPKRDATCSPSAKREGSPGDDHKDAIAEVVANSRGKKPGT